MSRSVFDALAGRLHAWIVERLIRLSDGRIGVDVRDRAAARGRVTATVYEVREDGTREQVAQHTSPNQILHGWDEQAIRVGATGGDAYVDESAGFKVGTDNTAPAYTNSDINNPVYTADLVSVTVDTNQLNVEAFLDTTEANGNDLVEGGLVSEGDTVYNHATYTAITKTENREVVYNITITQDSETTG